MRATLVVAAVMMAGSAMADVDDRWLDNPESGWQASVPAFDSTWMIPVVDWEPELPEPYPAHDGLPDLGDWDTEWDFGRQPHHPGGRGGRKGGGEYRCMAIGCEDGGDFGDDIIIVDCRDGKPC